MKKFFHRLRLRWIARGWKFEDHEDCIRFLGPCDQCRARMELNGKDPDVVVAEMNRKLEKTIVYEDP